MTGDARRNRPDGTATDALRREPAPPGRPAGMNDPRGGQAPVRRIQSADIFAGSPCVVIVHAGVEYRLQITRMGKLILTK